MSATRVIANNTMLTTIKTEDPMYAYFDVDERTVLGLRLRRQNDGNQCRLAKRNTELEVGLANEDGYSFKGSSTTRETMLIAARERCPPV